MYKLFTGDYREDTSPEVVVDVVVSSMERNSTKRFRYKRARYSDTQRIQRVLGIHTGRLDAVKT